MAKGWENLNVDDISTVRTGDIQQAEFTINKYRVEDGEVKSEEEGVDLGEEDLEELRAEIETEMDDALAEFEETGDVTTTRDIQIGPVGVPSPEEAAEAAAGGEESAEAEEGPEGPAEEEEDSADVSASDAEARGREIVEEENITKTDFPTFAKEMRESGFEDQETISSVWQTLRDDNTIDGDDEGTEEDTAPAEQVDVDVEGMETTTEQQEEDVGREADEDETEEAMGTIEPGTDILMVKEGHNASSRVAEVLGSPILDQEILAVPFDSDVGRTILDDMPSDVSVPFYVVAEADGFRQESLEDLLSAYA